jgi:putative spermidine/putrescine transport system ATP-binding protein
VTGGGRGALALRGVTKRYGEVHAVDGVSFDAAPGEFVTLLGPSGSGKTTTLRVIVGFVEPDAGTVSLDGRDITGVPSYERDMGMVFQNYALFPHMTAAQNVAFPLEMRRTRRAETARRVGEALELVHLGGLGARYPRQLSGGQQQRVALARAIVFAPRLLLMDEPLGALDKRLRETLQLEIKRISRELRTTVVYVTHDQDEALVLSDRIAVYNQGRIEQIGVPEALYEWPATLFVANFLGESNVFRGRYVTEGGPAVVAGRRRIPVGGAASERSRVRDGEAAAVVVRPERTRIRPAAAGGRAAADGTGCAGVLREVIYVGATRKYVVDLGGGLTALARVQAGQESADLAPGATVEVDWDVAHGVLVPDAPGAGDPADDGLSAGGQRLSAGGRGRPAGDAGSSAGAPGLTAGDPQRPAGGRGW